MTEHTRAVLAGKSSLLKTEVRSTLVGCVTVPNKVFGAAVAALSKPRLH